MNYSIQRTRDRQARQYFRSLSELLRDAAQCSDHRIIDHVLGVLYRAAPKTAAELLGLASNSPVRRPPDPQFAALGRVRITMAD